MFEELKNWCAESIRIHDLYKEVAPGKFIPISQQLMLTPRNEEVASQLVLNYQRRQRTLEHRGSEIQSLDGVCLGLSYCFFAAFLLKLSPWKHMMTSPEYSPVRKVVRLIQHRFVLNDLATESRLLSDFIPPDSSYDNHLINQILNDHDKFIILSFIGQSRENGHAIAIYRNVLYDSNHGICMIPQYEGKFCYITEILSELYHIPFLSNNIHVQIHAMQESITIIDTARSQRNHLTSRFPHWVKPLSQEELLTDYWSDEEE